MSSVLALLPPAFALLQSAIGTKGIVTILVSTIGTTTLTKLLSYHGINMNANDLLSGKIDKIAIDVIMKSFCTNDSLVLFVGTGLVKGAVQGVYLGANVLYYGAKTVYFVFKGLKTIAVAIHDLGLIGKIADMIPMHEAINYEPSKPLLDNYVRDYKGDGRNEDPFIIDITPPQSVSYGDLSNSVLTYSTPYSLSYSTTHMHGNNTNRNYTAPLAYSTAPYTETYSTNNSDRNHELTSTLPMSLVRSCTNEELSTFLNGVDQEVDLDRDALTYLSPDYQNDTSFPDLMNKLEESISGIVSRPDDNLQFSLTRSTHLQSSWNPNPSAPPMSD